MITNTFILDGTLSYTAHSRDTMVVANSVEAPFAELRRVTVGTSPSKVGVHPNGEFVYAIISQEEAVTVIDAATDEVVQRIEIDTNSNTIFVRGRA